jgi:glutamate synthase (NADPH/NADH) small chain
MGKVTGFLEIQREQPTRRDPNARIQDWLEIYNPFPEEKQREQGARCMDCGVPFCHTGCPVNNLIPDWNDLVYTNRWEAAIRRLHSTNNFPEFTGRVCPAPCEAACTLNIDDAPVTIKTIECQIVDRGWEEGWITPQPPKARTGRRVAVIGSGPAGLACAQQLARAGHEVTVFEKNDRIGGLLRYGIPDFKMEKRLIDQRLAQMEGEGVRFQPNSHVGRDVSLEKIAAAHDAVVLAGGAEWPRDLELPPHGLSGIHFAMEYLTQQNRRLAGDPEHMAAPGGTISAAGKHVVVIGGGDTGSDCIGTANRQGAASITQLEIMPQPPLREDKALTWPDWPLKLRTSSSQEEGCERDFAVTTRQALGRDGRIEALECARLEWTPGPDGRMRMTEIPDSRFELKADLVLLAMGFLGPHHDGLLEEAQVALDPRGNVAASVDDYRTSRRGVFACGDMRRGQSLVVWAIREGRQCARAVDAALMGTSDLPG